MKLPIPNAPAMKRLQGAFSEYLLEQGGNPNETAEIYHQYAPFLEYILTLKSFEIWNESEQNDTAFENNLETWLQIVELMFSYTPK